MSPAVWATLAVAVAFGAFVQASVGVGFALVLSPVLAVLAPGLLPGCVLLLMLPLNLFVAWRERAALDGRGASWITAGRCAGALAGLGVLALLSAPMLRLFVGAATLLTAAGSLLTGEFALRAPALLAAGVVTGVTETATGVGGPPMALLYQHQPAPVLRSTLATCFLLGELVSLLLLLAVGRLLREQVVTCALLLPVLASGAWASRWLRGRFTGGRLRVAVLVFAVLSGLICFV